MPAKPSNSRMGSAGAGRAKAPTASRMTRADARVGRVSEAAMGEVES